MSKTPSPLRYPGGKTQLYNFLLELFKDNGIRNGAYCEPFAGGAGLAIKLLLEKKVKRIIINDFDLAIYAIWYSIINHTSEFCDLIEKTPITIKEWNKQKEIYAKKDNNDILSLGFATFFLNRTNVSGVIKGGLIGGKKQSGKYKIDSRFNKVKLIDKIQNIAQMRNAIDLYNIDAKEFLLLKEINNSDVFINIDPPYVNKGSQLYTNFFKKEDHLALYESIIKLSNNWILTYDETDFIKNIYKDYRSSILDLKYNIGKNKQNKEYIFFSNNLKIPS
jgi:DNA adenine methylase